MKRINERDIALNGIIAAMYVVVTFLCSPIAYGAIQFRISEILVLLCFFNRKLSIGLVLGCLISNCASPMAAIDVPFGTLATLIACIGIMFSRHLIVAIFFPVFANAFIVAAELTTIGEPYWFSFLTVGAGELTVMIVGYIVLILLKKRKNFFEAIKANRNLDFKF